MSQPEIVGTWDGLEDAIDALNKGGLSFVLTVGMGGSHIARTRTNAYDRAALDWLLDQHDENSDELREQYPI